MPPKTRNPTIAGSVSSVVRKISRTAPDAVRIPEAAVTSTAHAVTTRSVIFAGSAIADASESPPIAALHTASPISTVSMTAALFSPGSSKSLRRLPIPCDGSGSCMRMIASRYREGVKPASYPSASNHRSHSDRSIVPASASIASSVSCEPENSSTGASARTAITSRRFTIRPPGSAPRPSPAA